jgi:hypothetical protein
LVEKTWYGGLARNGYEIHQACRRGPQLAWQAPRWPENLSIVPDVNVILEHHFSHHADIMMTQRFLALAAACTLTLLTACGGNDDGVKLGEFPAISVAEGDTVDLKAPSSKSPAPFNFSSSNPAIAEVSGTKLIGKRAGTATLTAGQGQMGSYNPTSTSTSVTVVGYVNQGGLVWMPPTVGVRNWNDAEAYCTNTTIRGLAGWRLPTQAELTALAGSAALSGQAWILSDTWTSNPGSAAKTHVAVNLTSKAASPLADDKTAAVTCVLAA